jgi:hypothetical protein
MNQRTGRLFRAESRIDAALDQPGDGDAREVGRDQRQNTENEKSPVPVNKEFDAVVIAKNFSVLWQAARYAVSSFEFLVSSSRPET